MHPPRIQPHASSGEILLAPNDEFRRDVQRLQSELQSRLPGHMIPELFLRVTHIPLTHTGKADRKRLREHVAQLPIDQVNEYLGLETNGRTIPITSAEKTIQLLWAKVLNLPVSSIGMNDSWTSLGGDSVLAMMLVSRATKEGFSITVPNILRHKTISEIARVSKRESGGMNKHVEPFELLGPEAPTLVEQIADKCQVDSSLIEDAYPCIALQYSTIGLSRSGLVNATMRLEFQISPDLNRSLLNMAWEQVVTANPVVRTRIVEIHEGEYLQAVVREGIPLHEESSFQSDLFAPEVDIFELGQPLLRVALQGNLFIMLIHHAAYDGYSWPMILRDIDRAYTGQTIQPYSYAPFIQWATSHDTPTRQFWINKFAGFHGQPFPPLRSVELSPLEDRQLHCQIPVVHDDYTTSNKLRLALAIVISWYQENTDVGFGTVSGRRTGPVPDIANVPVPTTQIFPDRIQLETQESLEFNMKKCQEHALATMEFEGIDSRKIRTLSHETAAACQFQTLLAVQTGKSISEDSIFKDWKMIGYGPQASWNLTILCLSSSDNVAVSVHLSEATMHPGIQWERFLDQFQGAFHLIQSKPHLMLEDVKSNLPAPRSKCFDCPNESGYLRGR